MILEQITVPTALSSTLTVIKMTNVMIQTLITLATQQQAVA